jgi:hypothetical protein
MARTLLEQRLRVEQRVATVVAVSGRSVRWRRLRHWPRLGSLKVGALGRFRPGGPARVSRPTSPWSSWWPLPASRPSRSSRECARPASSTLDPALRTAGVALDLVSGPPPLLVGSGGARRRALPSRGAATAPDPAARGHAGMSRRRRGVGKFACGPGSFPVVQLQITDEAKVLLEKRGGTMTIDFIRPTG